MAIKKRRTKKQKQISQNRRKHGEIAGFKIDVGRLDFDQKESKQAKTDEKRYRSYLRTDLTKTAILTMLALALELALWLYLSR